MLTNFCSMNRKISFNEYLLPLREVIQIIRVLIQKTNDGGLVIRISVYDTLNLSVPPSVIVEVFYGVNFNRDGWVTASHDVINHENTIFIRKWIFFGRRLIS